MEYRLENHDFNDPDPWIVLGLDRSTFFDPGAKEALLRGNASRSRQFLLPVVRPLARLSIVLVQLPDRHPQSPHIIARAACADRLGDEAIRQSRRQLPDCQALQHRQPDATVPVGQHQGHRDQVAPAASADDRGPACQRVHPARSEHLQLHHSDQRAAWRLGPQDRAIPLDKVDFSAIQNVDHRLAPMPDTWHNFLDLQTAIEIYTPLFALFLSDRDFWRSSNSLQLDETVACYIARIFDREGIIGLVNKQASDGAALPRWRRASG